MVSSGRGVHSGSLLAAASKVSAAAAAAAASEYLDEQSDVCKEVSVYALQAKATARVDVPGDPQTTRTRGGARRKSKAKFPSLLAHSPGSSLRHVMRCRYAYC